MGKFALTLKQEVVHGSLNVEANSEEEAIQKWEDGDVDMNKIEMDDRMGGIAWELEKVEEVLK